MNHDDCVAIEKIICKYCGNIWETKMYCANAETARLNTNTVKGCCKKCGKLRVASGCKIFCGIGRKII